MRNYYNIVVRFTEYQYDYIMFIYINIILCIGCIGLLRVASGDKLPRVNFISFKIWLIYTIKIAKLPLPLLKNK